MNIFIETHQILINHGFKKLNLRRIISTTIKELDDLICKVLKFKREGVMKKIFKNNKYHDLYISSVFKKNEYLFLISSLTKKILVMNFYEKLN